jgi:hypothetical protein
VKKVLFVAVLAAAVLVPTASASRTPRVKLALIPLPKAALGSGAKSLALQHQSGVLSNAAAAQHVLLGTSTKTFTKLGRITGYVVDYGAAASGGAGVTEVWTSIDEYKTEADAKKGLAFWKKNDPLIAQFNQSGFAVRNKAEKVPAVGSARFAFLASYSAANIKPLWTDDEQFTEGRYVLDVTVSAGTAAGATKLPPKLAKALDARLRQALAGKLHAKPVKLPAKQRAGAPSGGPDLSTLVLKTTDVTGQATVGGQGYFVDPGALSDYSMVMFPAGQFDLLLQDVEWYPTANQASFEADFATAGAQIGGGVSQLDLSAVGDGAQGVIGNDPTDGFAQIAFSTGQLFEIVEVTGQHGVQAADTQQVAQTAANYIHAAVPGG